MAQTPDGMSTAMAQTPDGISATNDTKAWRHKRKVTCITAKVHAHIALMELYRQTATGYGASVLQSIMVDFWPECPVLTQLRTALVSGQKGKTVAALR